MRILLPSLPQLLLKLRLSGIGRIANQSLKSHLPWLWARLRTQALAAHRVVRPFVRGHSTGARDYPIGRDEWLKTFIRDLK